MKRLLPPVLLFFLAPAIGELLSGSAPPAEFFSPFGLVILTVLYGGGAILARELKIRWRKGWLSLLVLGAAYGIIEEGLMVKSFFDPNWMDIGILGTYGRWLGINWVWSLELTIYHAIISIAIPIQLTELIFPGRKEDTWINRPVLITLSILFVTDIIFGYFALTPYRPNIIIYLLTMVVVLGIIIVAHRLPTQPFAPRQIPARNPFWFWLTGFLGTVVFFILFWGLPNTNLHAVITMLLATGLSLLLAWIILRMSGNASAWAEKHRLALVGGPLSTFILLSPIHEFDTSRNDNTTGMTIVGIGALLFLIWVWWLLKKRDNQAKLAVN